jgi:hypothetical protein
MSNAASPEYSLMLSRGNKLRGSFSLTPFKVTLCLLACSAQQSPIMQDDRKSQLYRYIVAQLKKENGIKEKNLHELKLELGALTTKEK